MLSLLALLTPVSLEISEALVFLPLKRAGSALVRTLLTCVWVAPDVPLILLMFAVVSNDFVMSLISILYAPSLGF